MVYIKAIEIQLPERIVTNEDLSESYPDWEMDKVVAKSGVLKRHIAGENETALDLAIPAVERLLKKFDIDQSEIGGIIFCTQSPDYIMPSNAFLIHNHFKFSSNVLAFDYNLACSGFVYGLAIVRGLIETNVADNILLINADTYSKFIGKNDRSTMVLFGDGAAVSLISKSKTENGIFDVILASSGKQYDSFYIPAGGSRMPKGELSIVESKDQSGNVRSLENIHMNGFGVWSFISRTVPVQIEQLLERNNLSKEKIDHFIFHQASKLTLDSLIKSLGLNPDKVLMTLDNIGNTVSASIPMTINHFWNSGQIKRGDICLVSGFGVGLSWGSLIMRF
jgi:3-oxoacyl-[acyl-carrier-protein] synthase III